MISEAPTKDQFDRDLESLLKSAEWKRICGMPEVANRFSLFRACPKGGMPRRNRDNIDSPGLINRVDFRVPAQKSQL